MNQNRKIYEKEFEPKVERLIENRTKVLNPFRLDANAHIYQFGLSPVQWAAFRILRAEPAFKNAINSAHIVYVSSLPPELPMRAFSVSIKHAHEEHFYPRLRVPWENLLPKVQHYLLKWCEYHIQLTAQENNAKWHVRRVGRHCNTWKQLATIWPSLVPLFPPDQRRAALAAKARSRLPEGSWDTDGKVWDWLSKEQTDNTQMILSEAMLLPDYSYVDHGPRPTILTTD